MVKLINHYEVLLGCASMAFKLKFKAFKTSRRGSGRKWELEGLLSKRILIYSKWSVIIHVRNNYKWDKHNKFPERAYFLRLGNFSNCVEPGSRCTIYSSEEEVRAEANQKLNCYHVTASEKLLQVFLRQFIIKPTQQVQFRLLFSRA